MATYVKTLLDNQDNIIYPQTKTSAIFDANNVALDVTLEKVKDIQISANQPTNQKTDDIWYKVIKIV